MRVARLLLVVVLCSVAAGAAEIAPGVHFDGQFLVSVRGTPAQPLAGLTARGWQVETLATTGGNATTPEKTWLLVTPPAGALAAAASQHAWDLGHHMVGSNALDGVDLSAVIEIEPNAAYEITGFHDRYTAGMAKKEKSAPVCPSPTNGTVIACGEGSKQWPNVKQASWHLDDTRTELRKAQQLAEPAFNNQQLVRIAHLDTGYYQVADTITPPRFLPYPISRSMIKDDHCGPTGIDCYQGGTPNGHGPRTLTMLAGGKVDFPGGAGYPAYKGYLGGAPLAEVFTLRVSPSVVLLRPLDVGTGIHYAIRHDADVLSMSMGGAPSYYLRDAVNEGYERGIPMFFAAADFFHLPIPIISIDIPPHTMVYPARFNTATPVSGVTAAERSYGLNPSWFLSVLRGDAFSWIFRGSYGPAKLMKNRALATYSPNVTSRNGARLANDTYVADQIQFAFSGTSAATPQAAAAAALWLQVHRGEFTPAEWRSWVKAESAYEALIRSADLPSHHGAVEQFGAGKVKAARALELKRPANPVKRTPGEIGVDWITILAKIIGLGFNQAPPHLEPIHRAMLRLEVAQLLATEPRLRAMVNSDFESTPSRAQLERIARELENHPRASLQLRRAVKEGPVRRP